MLSMAERGRGVRGAVLGLVCRFCQKKTTSIMFRNSREKRFTLNEIHVYVDLMNTKGISSTFYFTCMSHDRLRHNVGLVKVAVNG